MARSLGNSAQNIVHGFVSNGADWYETNLLKDENGSPLTDVDGDTWQYQFRKCPTDDSAELTLSTTGGTLTITEEDDRTTMLINCPQSSLTNMCGDYTADLVSKSTSTGRLTHRAHGTVTFNKAPIAF